MKKYLLFFLFCCCFMGLSAQSDSTFVFLSDATDMPRHRHKVQLDTTAKKLVDLFKDGHGDLLKDFKVFDFGFYLHNSSMKGGVAEAFEQAKELAAQQAPYYLLFAKESNEKGLYEHFWIDLKLPNIEGNPCFSDAKTKSIQALIEQAVNLTHKENNKNPYKFYQAELAGMAVLDTFLNKIKCCIEATNARNTTCSYCFYNQSQMVDLLKKRGMLEIEANNKDREKLEIIISPSTAYNNTNFQSDYEIKILKEYAKDSYEWNLTKDLNDFLPKVAGAKARVLYFDAVSCPNFEAYLEGTYPQNTSAFRRNNDTTFFEEIIILDIEGQQQVFFKFNGSDQSDASALWSLKHLFAGHQGGLSQTAIDLELEECANDFSNWLETWQNSKLYSTNWDFLHAAWEFSIEEPFYNSPDHSLVTPLFSYLRGVDFANIDLYSLEGLKEAGPEERINAHFRDFQKQVYKVVNAYFGNTQNSNNFYRGCSIINIEEETEEIVESDGRNEEKPIIKCVTDDIKQQFKSNDFFAPDGTFLHLEEGCTPHKVYGIKHKNPKKKASVFSFWCTSNNILYTPYLKEKDNSFIGYAPTGSKVKTLNEFEALKYNYKPIGKTDEQKIKIWDDCRFLVDGTFIYEEGTTTDCNCANDCGTPEINAFIAGLTSDKAKSFLKDRCEALSKDAQKKEYAFQIAIFIQNMGVFYEEYQENSPDPDSYNWEGHWAEYLVYAEALSDFDQGINNLYNDLNKAIHQNDWYRVYMILYHFKSDRYFEQLSVEQRVGIIRVLAQGPMLGNNIWENHEQQVLNVIKTIPNEPIIIYNFLSGLKASTNLLQTLLDKIDNWIGPDNREAFVTELARLVNLQAEDKKIESNIHLAWDLPDKNAYKHAFKFRYEFVDGNIKFDVEQCLGQEPCRCPDFLRCTEWKVINWDAVDPYALISFVDIDKVRVLGNNTDYLGQWKKHEKVPAIFAAYVIKQALAEQNFEKAIKTVEIGSLFLGAGELAAAIKIGSRWRIALAGYTLTSDVASIVLKKDGIKKFLKDQNDFSEADAEKISTYIDNILSINAFLAGTASFIDLQASARAAAAVERGKEIGVDFSKIKKKDIGNISGEQLDQFSVKAIDELLEHPEGKAALAQARFELRAIGSTLISPEGIAIAKIGENSIDFVRTYLPKNDNFIDIVIHGSGRDFFVEVEGKLQSISIDDLAIYLKANFVDPSKPVRLLSCSNLDAAQELSAKLGRSIVTTNSKILLYKDGSIGTYNNAQWYHLSNTETKKINVNWDIGIPNEERKFFKVLGDGEDVFDIDNTFIEGVDNLNGKVDFGWYDEETAFVSISAILKSPNYQGRIMQNLTSKIEELARAKKLSNIRIEFRLVVNPRLATDSNWAREYGYSFFADQDKWGITVLWEKYL